MRSYLTILSLPGALAFCVAGFLARVGGAMIGIGTVLMVQALYGSYGLAGAVAATNSAGWAIGAAVLANLVDRYGQRRVMLPAITVSVVMLALLVILASWLAPAWTLFVPSAISGASSGAAGGMVRARWNHLLNDQHQLHTAFSLESTLDEVSFIFGPVVATALATSLFPGSALTAVCVLTAVGSLLFYSLRATEPPPHRLDPSQNPGPRPSDNRLLLAQPGFTPVVLATLSIGMAFGSIDVTTVAAAEAWGGKWIAGPILAIMSAGSAAAGLAYGARRWKAPLATRFLVGVLAFGLGASTFWFASSPIALAICGLVAGSAIAPTFITANSLAQRLVPESRLTEGLALIGTSIGIGVSIGATIAGQVIDAFGWHAGFVTLFVVALIAIIIAITSNRALQRLTPAPSAAAATTSSTIGD